MKRVSSGTKKKQPAPARKPALRRAPRSPKSKSAPRATAKRPTPDKKAKPAAKSKSPKLRATKTKRVNRPRRKTTATQVTAPEKVAIEVSPPVLTRTRATTRRKAVRKKVVRAKKLALEAAPAPAKELPESKFAVVNSASQHATRKAAPKKTVRKRISVRTTPSISPPVMPSGRSVRKTASTRKSTRARKTISAPQTALPAFLFEGDEPGHPEISGPGEKFSLGPIAPLDHFAEAATPLPESYGTGRLFLTARDPHWLYAHWDFTREEQFRHNARSVDRHLVLRVHPAMHPDQTIGEYHVHPESKHWFVHVEQAGESYSAELGYYQTGRKWKSLTASTPQRTPPNNISADATVEFATLPLELSFETMLALLRGTADAVPPENIGLARAIESIRASTREGFPDAMQIADWTPEQEQALEQVLAAAQAGAALPSSQDSGGEADIAFAEFSATETPSSYVSSFFGGEMPVDFWLNVNAELVVYGATQPGAQVHVAGKEVLLRPDGSFRFHFALPDGTFALPITAVSASGADTRGAELKFSRATEWRGAAGAPPPEPALEPPPQSP
jgi:uncharacterized protein